MNVRAITDERLAVWIEDIVEANATPVLLLAVGHEHRSGEIHLFFPEDLNTVDVMKLMVRAAYMLGQQSGVHGFDQLDVDV
ncbi:MAG: hypothetical protein ACE5KY_06580 [Candidatus Tectimicrobiota bacterium]